MATHTNPQGNKNQKWAIQSPPWQGLWFRQGHQATMDSIIFIGYDSANPTLNDAPCKFLRQISLKPSQHLLVLPSVQSALTFSILETSLPRQRSHDTLASDTWVQNWCLESLLVNCVRELNSQSLHEHKREFFSNKGFTRWFGNHLEEPRFALHLVQTFLWEDIFLNLDLKI